MRILALGAFLIFLTTCSSQPVREGSIVDEGVVTKRNISRQVAQTDSIYVVTSDDLSVTVKDQINFSRRGRSTIPLSFIDFDAYIELQKEGKVFFFIHNLELQNTLKPMLEELGVKDSLNRLHINGKVITGGAAFFSFFPFEESIVGLLIADDLSRNDGLKLVSRRRNMDYEIINQGQTTLKGVYKNWRVDNSLQWRFESKATAILEQNGSTYHFWGNFDSSLRKQIADERENYWSKATAVLGSNSSLPLRDLHFYKDYETKSLKFQNDQSLHITNNSYYGVFDQEYPREIIRQILSADIKEVIKDEIIAKGLAVSIFDEYFDHPPHYWYEKLIAGNLLIKSLDSITSIKQMQSTFIADLNAGFLVRFLLDNGISLQLKSSELVKEKKLEKHWVRALKNLNDGKEKKQVASSLPFQKGFNFAHEGYQIYNGFGSTLANASMKDLKDINGNAIAVVPYTFMRKPTIPVPLQISTRAGGETDGAVINNIKQAKALNLMVTMKPQIWLSGGSWPGDIEMKTKTEADLFFHHYGNWIKHYALLSQIHDVDLLCIGVEMVKTTTSYPARWKKLIKEIRALYDGPLVYAANWGDEFEQISFWKDLDYIGLNCYYPLSDHEELDVKKIKKNLKSTMNMVEGIVMKAKKPLLLTEVGFRSSGSPWVQPHAKAANKSVNESNQALCFQLFFDEMGQRDWFTGWFWWKWPSYASYRSNNPQSFAPAEETKKVIKSAFAKPSKKPPYQR